MPNQPYQMPQEPHILHHENEQPSVDQIRKEYTHTDASHQAQTYTTCDISNGHFDQNLKSNQKYGAKKGISKPQQAQRKQS